MPILVGQIRKDLEKCGSVIVIADGEMNREVQPVEMVPQLIVVASLAPVRQIAGDDQDCRVEVLFQPRKAGQEAIAKQGLCS